MIERPMSTYSSVMINGGASRSEDSPAARSSRSLERCLGRLNDHGAIVQLIDKNLLFRVESIGESFLCVKRKVSTGYGDFRKGYGGKVGARESGSP